MMLARIDCGLSSKGVVMILAIKVIVLLLLAQSVWAQAQVECHPKHIKQVEHIPEVLAACERQSEAQARDFLKWKIGEDLNACQIRHKETNVQAYLRCVRSSVREAREILSCSESLKRYREVRASDVREMQIRLSRYQPAQLPESIAAIFSHLTSVADQYFQYKFDRPVWALHAYQDKIPNATAAISGDILISDAVWTGEKKFPENEIAAILAHEISHVVQNHMLSLGCLAIEWIGPSLSVGEALEAFQEDFIDGFPRKERWKRLSQSLEFEADRIGIRLLKLAGYDENSMVQVLRRLKSQTVEGFTTGSHPGFDERIRRAQNEVVALKGQSI